MVYLIVYEYYSLFQVAHIQVTAYDTVLYNMIVGLWKQRGCGQPARD